MFVNNVEIDAFGFQLRRLGKISLREQTFGSKLFGTDEESVAREGRVAGEG
jgi:hypothetical protein